MGDVGRLRVDVLGPLRVRAPDGRDVTPDGALQRRLLALLVLRRGHVVSVDAAIDALWPADPPRDPVAALQNHVFRLRRALPLDVVESLADGYRAAADRLDVDADRLIAALRDDPGPEARATIDDALERWHGPAYPELADVDDGRAEALRLDELRLRAVEQRAEWRLADGDVDGLPAMLAALIEQEPLRERPRALLMAVLAKGGRAVDALRVYDDFRRLLGDELGVEPSPEIAALHADLLAGSALTGWAPATRLPVPVTSLVGRDALVGDVVRIAEEHRVVTLLGPGGVGKTRLLVEVGARLLAERPDRPVVLCELAAAGTESAVDAVAAALRIEGRPGVGLADRIATALGDTELVLLVDNCEHVLDPVAALVETVLGACPRVTVVATSRERLRIAGERLCAVAPLPYTGDEAPAVRLFVERAGAVAPDFDPDAGDLALVGEIVQRLDGLPLAIELAAARLHTLDVAEVAAGLDHRFAVLSSGSRTSTRHGSLHAAVSWSYGMLDGALQRVFADLSIFSGPFALPAAAAVCGLDATAAAGALDQLVERSLVMRAPGREYVLLETLRAFGTEELAATGRARETADRHARYHVAWTEAADRRLLDPGARPLRDIDAALPELRTALGFLLDCGDVEGAGRLVAALLDYGLFRLRRDVLAWAERVTKADGDDASPVAPVVWAVAAYAAWMGGDVTECAVRSARALQASARAGIDAPSEALMSRANVALFEGRLDEATAWYRRARDAGRDDRAQHLLVSSTELLPLAYAGDPGAPGVADEVLQLVGELETVHAAYAWHCAGEVAAAVDLEEARARFDRALELAEANDASFVAGIASASRASIDARVGDPFVAAERYRRLIGEWRRAGVWSTQWTVLRSVAGLLARLGRHHDAAMLLGAVRATGAGHRIFGADQVALTELDGRLRAALGDDACDEAYRSGAALDGDGAVELALAAL